MAFVISLLIGFLQLFNDFRAQEKTFDEMMQRVLDVSYPPARQAVVTVDKVLAKEVLNGLMQYPYIRSATILDQLNNLVATEHTLFTHQTNTKWFTQLILPPEKHYEVTLSPKDPSRSPLGKLLLDINIDEAYQSFYNQAINSFVVSIIRNTLLAGCLIALFYLYISKPIAALAHQFTQLNPRNPKEKRLSVVSRQKDTELGQLAAAGNHYIDVVRSLLNEQERHHAALVKSEQRLNHLIDLVPQHIVAFGEATNILFCNASFAEFLQEKQTDLIGVSFEDFIPDTAFLQQLKDTYKEVVSTREVKSLGEYVITDDDGNQRYFSSQLAPFEHFHDDAVLMVCTDVTEHTMAQNHIRHLASHDALTGLPNRNLLNDRLEQSLAACRVHETFNALLFIDLDHFKVINDSLGHGIGDLLLKEVAHIIQANVDVADTVARLGGDEFVVLLQAFEADRAVLVDNIKQICTHILAQLMAPIDIQGHQLRIGASIGVAIFPLADESIDDLMRFSDIAMYHAKEHGRNGYAFYTPEMSMAVENQHSLKSELHDAFKRQEFRVYYQPIVDFAGNISGFEALLRWEHPERGLLFPGSFIEDLENSSMLAPISEWVLRHTTEQINQWKGSGYWQSGWYVAVNISPLQFYHQGLEASVERLFKEQGLQSEELCIEITETVALENINFAINRLKRLRKLGCKIALDDFGTGYSSLSYLKQLPIDIVKVDRVFVKELGEESKSNVIVEAVCTISQAYNLTVVAEGIEELPQMQHASLLGCHLYQGFMVAKPVPVADLKASYHSECLHYSPVNQQFTHF